VCFAKDTKQRYRDEFRDFFTFYRHMTPQPKEKCFRGDQCKQAKCFHHPMLDENTMNGWEHCKADLELEFPFIRTIGP
jgi:hypothetical protein